MWAFLKGLFDQTSFFSVTCSWKYLTVETRFDQLYLKKKIIKGVSMTFLAEISKGVIMCVLDEITNGGVGKGATMPVFAQKYKSGSMNMFWGKKYQRG